ncbi:MAG: GtrA family protein, partial [Rhodobacteraceae bacterium]|nr:GtrA family protein [Paracoccaceae bacterium]
MQQETARLIRYAAVGIGVLLVYLALNLIFLQLGLTAGTANVMAFVLAVCVQYLGQTAFAFGVPLNNKPQVVRFFVMIVLGWSASQIIVL